MDKLGINPPFKRHLHAIIQEIMPEDREWFQTQLRSALTSLYSPPLLRKNALIGLLSCDQKSSPTQSLQTLLLNAIESLRPNERAPSKSEAWRLYQILRRRYTEQVPQNQVAIDLSLSIRQLQREESIAREELGDHLIKMYNLGVKLPPVQERGAVSGGYEETVSEPVSARLQELEHLDQAVPAQEARLDRVIEEMLETITPLATSRGVIIHCEIPDDLPPVFLAVPLLRQALLTITSVILWEVEDGRITVQIQATPNEVVIEVRGETGGGPSKLEHNHTEEMETAFLLVKLCGAKASAVGDPIRKVTIHLPALEQRAVLIIDDNQDTLQLFRRYLSGSHYRMISAQSAAAGEALLQESSPQIVVLDVMMPEQDGWRLLSLIRQRLGERMIPVIICSILPQENLALALGAADFLRKPVNRDRLLEVLDRQLKA